ncbi:hypothetical protein HYS31_00295 [Candidatus Woesearchaeota archaeon]|nr:hypothetical protein [Candidatus Woesearchaeota archaeon]
MNRQLEEDVDRAWNSISPKLRSQIEQETGLRREDTSAEVFGTTVLEYLRAKLVEVSTERRIRESVDNIRREIHEETRAYLQGLGNQFEQYMGKIADRLDERDRQLRYILEEIKSQRTASPQIEEVPRQQISSPQNVYVSTPLKMDCRYVKNGPKECIEVYHESGGTYGTCTIGDQVRKTQIMGRWITNAMEQSGCPSRRIIKVCEYLKNRIVKIS